MNDLLLLLRISLRNLFSSFLNVIIGLIILAGTLFFVVGGSLVNSMDEAMSRSIIGSMAGHAQIYDADSKDSPALFDSFSPPELEPIPDFSVVKGPLLAHPNVKSLVPMGVSTAIINYGNTVDQALEKLRTAMRPGSGVSREQIQSLKAHVRQIAEVIQGDYAKFAVLAEKGMVDRQAERDLEEAVSDGFWRTFDADPLRHLEFLENHIASLIPDADQIFLGYAGTDLDAFAKAFDRMEIVDGGAVPAGRRGILLSKYIYETQFKLKIARRLDEIHQALNEQGKTIKGDPALRDLVKQNRTQTREIILQLDPLASKKFLAILQAELGTKDKDLPAALSAFLDTDDGNFEARYEVFYGRLAPFLELYRLKPGEMLTIKAYTKSGFQQALNIRVYGTFQFKGLEKSGLAGALSLMDLMSFRDLYGYVTPEKIAETRQMQAQSGARAVDRDNAEAELFGGSSVVSQASQASINDRAELGAGGGNRQREDQNARAYTPSEIEKGVAIEAAVVLRDPHRLKETLRDIQAISDRDKLGLKVVDWQKAAGNLGQFVTVAKMILYLATFIIFIVALVIINNAVMMATLQRSREIGTLRAIGAQRGFVLAMVLTETVVLGLAFGTAGVLLGSGIVAWLGHAGIPAGNEFMYFFFSGPRLHPVLSMGSVLGAFAVVFLVACISAFYPALMATRVSPIQAMAAED